MSATGDEKEFCDLEAKQDYTERRELTNPQFSVCGGAVVHEMGWFPKESARLSSGTAALERGAEGEP